MMTEELSEQIDTDIKQELSESGDLTGIEADVEDECILEPFDPDSISIEQKVVAMDTLIRRLEQKSIHLSPSFQRKEVWDITRRSRLIESLILKIPLPMFYVAAGEDGQWEVVDGLQRLSTIRDFIIGDKNGEYLKLKNLEFLNEKFGGKTYPGIERDPNQHKLINTIRETEMRFTVINPGTPEEVKRNIFKRINTGGMPLTGQEIRHALYQGQSSDLLAELIEMDVFKSAIVSKINDSRMGARELVLRFLAFLIFPRGNYKSGMDGFLSNTMRVINCMPNMDPKKIHKIYQNQNQDVPNISCTNIDEIREKFKLAMVRGKVLFGQHAFRKSLPHYYRKAPINKALFEVWSNILCQLSENDFTILLNRKSSLLKKYGVLINTTDFNSSISRHSSRLKGVLDRHHSLSGLVNDTILGIDND